MGVAIGIDLGTTNSVCAVMDGEQPTIISNQEGKRLTPSIVGFKKGKRIIGHAAKRQLELHPLTTIHSIKRYLGRRYEEASLDFELVNYRLNPSKTGDCLIEINGQDYTPQELSAFILRDMKQSAEAFLGESVTEAVITVPAYFNDRQRQATKDAGALAGLDILRVINEPTAAALAYTYNKKGSKNIAVYDFGGGTFDVSILQIDGDLAQVLSTCGDNMLGGNDIDHEISLWLKDVIKTKYNTDLSSDLVASQRIREASERAKIDLSSSQMANINLPFLFVDENGPQNIQEQLTREMFDRLIEPYIKRSIAKCEQAIKESRLTASDIAEVVLVGGSSRIIAAQTALKELFPCRLSKSQNPDEVVALGASIQAASLTGEASKAVTLLDVTAFSLGIEVSGGKFAPLIHKNSTIPIQASRKVTTSIDNQRIVKIHVLQGEAILSRDNISLGEFELSNIQPAPSGAPQIEVLFKLDSNGMVQVSAKDLRTGNREEILIENTDGLSKSVLEDIKTRMNDELNPQAQELKSKIENLLVDIDTLMRKREGDIHKNTQDQVRAFQKKTRAALSKAQDTTLLEQLYGQVDKLHQKLNNQL
jgi:molecular chaperone DnaK